MRGAMNGAAFRRFRRSAGCGRTRALEGRPLQRLLAESARQPQLDGFRHVLGLMRAGRFKTNDEIAQPDCFRAPSESVNISSSSWPTVINDHADSRVDQVAASQSAFHG